MANKLHKRQQELYFSKATEILYGGAAGGGKSHAMRLIAISYALQVPNCQIYLFRRIFSDLAKNHIEGASGFNALLIDFIKSKHVSITSEEITFWNGSKIYLCHCQHEKNTAKYQGAEIHILLVDELTHFSEKIYRFLRGRCRLGSLVVPAQFKEKLPLIICGSNPGGVGHDFVKQTFIDGCKPMEIRRMPDFEGGMLRQFIPAKLADNPTMTENDPLYAAKLEGLGGALARAMLDGDWDCIDGAYFDNFDKTKHIIEPFFSPPEWFKIRAFDWGYSKPFCVLWGAVSDGSLVDCGGIKRSFPRGAIIIYREFYGCTGKANEGLKMHAGDIAKNTKEMQQGEKMNDMVADPAIFDVSSGESIMEQMSKEKIHWRPADNKRIAGWQQIRARFSGQDDKPLLYFTNNCKNLIRTLPIMQYDNTKPEDLNSDLEDHACFIAGTMVDTDKGKIQIEKLNPNLHKILAGNKWTNDYYPALTKKKAKTIKLTFENGVVVICTPHHKILDITDTWRYAKDFNNQLALWTVKPVRCVSVEDWNEQPVYCLFEPKTNSFTIEGGLIVHNCDTLRYLCMSRPVVVEVPKSQMALEEQWYKDFNPKNYSTNRK